MIFINLKMKVMESITIWAAPECLLNLAYFFLGICYLAFEFSVLILKIKSARRCLMQKVMLSMIL